MDENKSYLDSLLARRKALQAIKDVQQRSLKRKREENPTMTISKQDKLSADNVEDIINEEKCNTEIETSAANKKINIISVLYKPPGVATFGNRKPSSAACLSSLLEVQPPSDTSTTDPTVSQSSNSYCVSYDYENSRDSSALFPASTLPKSNSSMCVSQDNVYFASPLPISNTTQTSNSLPVLQDDTHPTAPLPISTTIQANDSLSVSQDDTHLTATLPMSATTQVNGSRTVLQDGTHLTAPLPISTTIQANDSLSVSQDDTHLIATLPMFTTTQVNDSRTVLQDGTHLTAPLPISTTIQANDSLSVSQDDTHLIATLPMFTTTQVNDSRTVLQDGTHLTAPLPISTTTQASNSLSVLLADSNLTRSLSISTTTQANDSLCVLQVDNHLMAPLLISTTTQANKSFCMLQAATHLTATLPIFTTTQASSSLCVLQADTHLSAPLSISTTTQARDSLSVIQVDTHHTVPLTISTTTQGSSPFCVLQDDIHQTAPLPVFTTTYASSSRSLLQDGIDLTAPFAVSTNTKASSSVCVLQEDDGDSYLHGADIKLYQRDEPISSGDEGLIKRRRQIRKAVKKSFIDFLSEDEENPFSAGSSDNWTINGSDESSNSDCNKNKQRRFKKIKSINKKNVGGQIKDSFKKEKPLNKYKLNKKLRDAGQSFENKKGEIIGKKTIQKNPCILGKCKRRCFEITEERRSSLHNFFWSLDAQRRKDWIAYCSRAVSVDRKRTDSPDSRRNITYEYYVNDGEGHRQVCQKFLLSTLDIKQKYLLYTISRSIEGMAQIEQRKRTAASKYSESAKLYVIEFIGKLPALPSHYTRKHSNRVYLSQELKNISNLYRIYKNDCQVKDKEVVSQKIFREIFNEEFSHVSFHIPKKDKCILCTKSENQDIEETEHIIKLQQHIKEKKASYKRFYAHQNINTVDKKTVTASFDLQKVLNTPHGESMLLYYSRKYAVYNFTLYESGTQEGYCFTWGECDGKRGSNEIASCLFNYLKDVDARGVQNLLLYCDSCSGQNKNKTVLSTLNYYLALSKNLQVIQINFLLPGHTYMPADSMHATIEKEVKNLIVWSPSHWATYFETARKRPKLYIVNVMDFGDFLDWEEVTAKTFSKDTLKCIKWRELRIATFKKKNLSQVEIKHSMTESAETQTIQLYENNSLKQRVKGKGKGKKGKGKIKDASQKSNEENNDRHSKVIELNLRSLYTNKLPISTAKYNDLKRLCENGTIPKRFHDDYLYLPFESQIIETLLDTDEEDDRDDLS